MSTDSNISWQETPSCVRLTLARAEKLNPLDWVTVRELKGAVAKIEGMPGVVAVVITGPSDPASLSSQATRSKPLSIAAPPQALGFGDTCTTSLRFRAGRSATVEAATRLAGLGSHLAAAAGPRLGSAKAPALATAWR